MTLHYVVYPIYSIVRITYDLPSFKANSILGIRIQLLKILIEKFWQLTNKIYYQSITFNYFNSKFSDLFHDQSVFGIADSIYVQT